MVICWEKCREIGKLWASGKFPEGNWEELAKGGMSQACLQISLS